MQVGWTGSGSDVNGNVIKHNIAKGGRDVGATDSAYGFIGLEVRRPAPQCTCGTHTKPLCCLQDADNNTFIGNSAVRGRCDCAVR